MAIHETTCPSCGAALVVNVIPHTGGSVEENIGVSLGGGRIAESSTALAAAKKAAAEAQAKLVAVAQAVLAEASETPAQEAAEEAAVPVRFAAPSNPAPVTGAKPSA